MNVWQVTQELMRIPGIGERKAGKVVLELGETALETIAADPTRLHHIPGLANKDILTIVTHVVGQQHRIRLRTYLDEYALGWLTDKVYERYGVQWEQVLRYTPYVLVGFGASWALADAVYLSEEGRGEGDEVRILAAIEEVTRKAVAQGHSYLSRPLLKSRLLDLLGWDHIEHVEQEITRACMGENQLYVTDLTMIERAIAQMLAELQAHPPGRRQELASMGQASLSPQQAAALDRAVTNKVSILTGGPGTGKTTTLKALTALLKASGVHVTLCAPTGRAAKRLSQITGEPASTIHRLLGYNPQEGWKRDETTVLATEFLVLDEFSMVDSVLFYHLLKALPVTACLLLVGDVDQLPSVGPGCVLSDVLASDTIPATRLTEVFRQEAGSAIIVNAHRINAGLLPYRAYDFTFFERDSPAEVAITIVGLFSEVAIAYHLNPFTDIQVLAPMYRGDAGVDALNTALQGALNHGGRPHIQAGHNRTIRYGDKVIQTRNNYEKGTYNGDMGKVVKVDVEQGGIVVAFEDEFGPHYASYARAELAEEIQLAYAVTVHKSQGSEYPVVIVPLVTEHAAMLQRNLLYTAVTRATQRVILVGQPEALCMAVENNRSMQRNTTLKEVIQHGRETMQPV